MNLFAVFFFKGMSAAFCAATQAPDLLLKHIGRLFEGTRPYARITG